MPNYSKNSVILVRYPFSDLSAIKVRPAVIVNSDSSFMARSINQYQLKIPAILLRIRGFSTLFKSKVSI